jgi:FkbM family methyltransferase
MEETIAEYPTVNLKFVLPNDGMTRRHLDTVMNELYNENEYGELDVKGKTVLDIGAYLGDTAIYFARKGAARVISLEPMATFDYIQKNVAMNGVPPGIVFPVRAYVGFKLAGIRTSIVNNGGSRIVPGADPVKHYSLGELIKEFEIPKGSIMKIDAEGGEYHFFASATPEELRHFSQISAEVHWIPGNDKDAPERKLAACGFEVSSRREYSGTWILTATVIAQ